MCYKKELFRGFNGFMNFSFCFTSVSVVSSCAVLVGYGLTTGGPVVMVWSWVIGSFFSILVGMSMAEICSSYPSTGSVYHWSAMLASPRWAPIASYICGWFNFVGNAAGDASFAYGFGQFVVAAVVLDSDGAVNPPLYATTLIAVGVSALWAVKNLMRVDRQGWFNNFSGIYQMVCT